MHYKKLLAAALTLGCTASTVPVHNTNAATMKIGYGGKTRYYNGSQLTFDYKNKKLSGKYAGIQINNTNMVPYYFYLVKQGPKVKRSYSSKTGKIVLKYGKKTLTAYSGKRTYYLNGAKKTFSVAPTKVKYYSTGSTIILMPAKETVQGLGMKYKYTSSSKRVSINYLTNSSSSTQAKPTQATTAQAKPVVQKNTTVYTNYAKTLSAYVTAEKKQHPAYGGKSISKSTYTTYINPAKDATHNYQFLRLNTYRPVNATAYNNLLNKKLKSGSVLKNKGNVLIAAAKKYNIDPVYLLCQTILETGYGQSVLSQGKSVTSVVSGKSVVKDRSTGKVTGFKTVNGKYITSKISKQKVYNLYGIKAYDSAPQLCGFSYAYYHKWTSVDKAIYGAAQYVSEQYIHNKEHNQNTLYKFRYHPNSSNLWHEYATDPAYAKQIGYIMYSQFRSVYASNATFTYDKPKFK